MAEGRYYWIKLRTDFFADDSPMDILLSQPNGSEYVCLYIKLCLATANKEGRLCNQFGEMIVPYDIEKIQRDMKYFSIDTVRVALELYQKLGLIYEESDGVLTISGHQDMVGSEGKSAKWMRDKRERDKNHIQITSKSQSDIEIRDIEIRDKDIKKKDKEKERKIYYPTDSVLNDTFISYIEMRKKIKAPMTEKAIELALSKLESLSGGDNDKAIEILNRSIMNSWKGLFPLKDEKGKEKSIIDEWMNA